MTPLLPSLLTLFLLSHLAIVGTRRFRWYIWALVLQGTLLAITTWVLYPEAASITNVAASILSAVCKTALFPSLIFFAAKYQKGNQSNAPVLGKPALLGITIGIITYTSWLGTKLPIPTRDQSELLIAAAMGTILYGLLILITHRGVISQVTGYLVFENGITLFSITLCSQEEWLVQLLAFLDVFVVIMLFGIIIFHLKEEFDEIDVDELSFLKD